MGSTAESSSYLDEFLGLRPPPELARLFPNAKEVSESVAVWHALRDRVLPALGGVDVAALDADGRRRPAIVVVGDGSRPRTAALCAHLLAGCAGGSAWDCVSVDPMAHYDSASGRAFLSARAAVTADDVAAWRCLPRLVVVRDKVQAVTIAASAAVVVMMHCHTSLADAVAAVDASCGVVGVVACPCCNWEPAQRAWEGRPPQWEYADARMLSDRNLVRVWTQPPTVPVPVPAPAGGGGGSSGGDGQPLEAAVAGGDPAAVVAALLAAGDADVPQPLRLLQPSAVAAVFSAGAAGSSSAQPAGAPAAVVTFAAAAGVVGSRRSLKQRSFIDVYDLQPLADRVQGEGAADRASSDLRALLADQPRLLADALAAHAQADALCGRAVTLSPDVTVSATDRARAATAAHEAAVPPATADGAAADRGRQPNAAAALLRGAERLQVTLLAGSEGAKTDGSSQLQWLHGVKAGDVVCLLLALPPPAGTSVEVADAAAAAAGVAFPRTPGVAVAIGGALLYRSAVRECSSSSSSSARAQANGLPRRRIDPVSLLQPRRPIEAGGTDCKPATA